MEIISIPFKPDYEDWLHARRILRSKEKLHYLYDFGTQFGVCVGWIAATIASPFSLTVFVVGTVLVAGVTTLPFLLNKRNWNRTWRKEQGQAFIEISDVSVSVRYEHADTHANSSVLWHAVKAFEEDQRVFFFPTKGSMLFFSRRSVTPIQAEAIRSLARDKVTP